jgi:hypothetical protein
MPDVLATSSLHDGGGIFTCVWALVMTPYGLALLTNFRGATDRAAAAGLRSRKRRQSYRSSFYSARFAGVVFTIAGPVALAFAINRFVHDGY